MPLNGVHIACGYSGPRGGSHGQISLLGRTIWSQTMASPGTTALGAPLPTDQEAEPIFSIYASEDIYFAVGATPDATNGPRRFLPATTPVDVFAVASGADKVAWVLA